MSSGRSAAHRPELMTGASTSGLRMGYLQRCVTCLSQLITLVRQVLAEMVGAENCMGIDVSEEAVSMPELNTHMSPVTRWLLHLWHTQISRSYTAMCSKPSTLSWKRATDSIRVS